MEDFINVYFYYSVLAEIQSDDELKRLFFVLFFYLKGETVCSFTVFSSSVLFCFFFKCLIFFIHSKKKRETGEKSLFVCLILDRRQSGVFMSRLNFFVFPSSFFFCFVFFLSNCSDSFPAVKGFLIPHLDSLKILLRRSEVRNSSV